MSSFEKDLDSRTVAQVNGIVGHAHRVTNAYRHAASRLHDMGARALVGRLLHQHVRAVAGLENALGEAGWLFPTRSDMSDLDGEESLRISDVNDDDAILEALAEIDAWLVASLSRGLPNEIDPSIGSAIEGLRELSARRRDQLVFSDNVFHHAVR